MMKMEMVEREYSEKILSLKRSKNECEWEKKLYR